MHRTRILAESRDISTPQKSPLHVSGNQHRNGFSSAGESRDSEPFGSGDSVNELQLKMKFEDLALSPETKKNFQDSRNQPSLGEFNVFSSHAPFVTPVRSNISGSTANGIKSTPFLSPVLPNTGRSDVSVDLRQLPSGSGHWTVHNYSSTPFRGTSKWSGARSVGRSRIGRSPFDSKLKRRALPEEEALSEEPSKKQTDRVATLETVGGKFNSIDNELLEKLGKEVNV